MKQTVIAALFLMFGVSFAEIVTVEGIVDCGQWLKARKENKSAHYETHLIGLISGMALGREIDIWNARGVKISRDQLYYWMDSYCQKSPLDAVVTGALEFADERTNGVYGKKGKQLR